jgi:uncharacterized protein involved in outer membrane biogenesis
MTNGNIWVGRILKFSRSSLVRKILLGLLSAVLIFTVASFFGVPLLVRHTMAQDMAARLKRPVEVGKVSFNPFILLLNINNLRIGESHGSQTFLKIRHLRTSASWKSLFRLAPIIKQLIITKPYLYLVRSRNGRFNFAGLLEKKPAQATKPLQFAVSNIQIRGGEILFDDREFTQRHWIRDLSLDIPFIANFPADVNVDAIPRVQMLVDNSPVRIVGRARPFASPPGSTINLKLDQLALARFAGYLPHTVPIKISQGTFSAALLV